MHLVQDLAKYLMDRRGRLEARPMRIPGFHYVELVDLLGLLGQGMTR